MQRALMHRVAEPQQTHAESVLRFMGLALYNIEEQIGTYARISYASPPPHFRCNLYGF